MATTRRGMIGAGVPLLAARLGMTSKIQAAGGARDSTSNQSM